MKIRALSAALLLALLVFSTDSYSQYRRQGDERNFFYFEFLGSGFYYSFNYERVAFAANEWLVFGRVGTSYVEHSMFFPLLVGVVSPSHLEFGGGVAYALHFYGSSPEDASKDSSAYKPAYDIFPTLLIGYRMKLTRSNIMFRFAITPLLDRMNAPERYWYGEYKIKVPIIPWAGISWGYAF